jgi:hypothetical protein
VTRIPDTDWHGAERHRQRLVDVLRDTPLPKGDAYADLRRAVTAFLAGSRPEPA